MRFFNEKLGSTLEDDVRLYDLLPSLPRKNKKNMLLVTRALNAASRRGGSPTVGEVRHGNKKSFLRMKDIGVKSALFLTEGFRRTNP